MALILLPFFNDFPYFKEIAEGFLSPSLLCLYAGFFFYFCQILNRNIFSLKDIFFITTISFIVFVSSLVNYFYYINFCLSDKCLDQVMINNSFSMMTKFLLVLFIIDAIRSVGIEKFLICIRLGFYISLFYMGLEVLDQLIPYYVGYDPIGLVNILDSIFHHRQNDWGYNRIRGLSFEPGYQGVYLIYLLPFLMLDSSRKSFKVDIILVVTCIFLTLSPPAIFATAIFFLIYWLHFNIQRAVLFGSLLLFFSIALCVFIAVFDLSILINIESMTSTRIRVGSWVASLMLLKENLIFGVGPGLSGLFLHNFYPDFFYNTPETEKWLNLAKNNLLVPTFSGLISFLLDFGIFGLTIVILYCWRSGLIRFLLSSPVAIAGLSAALISSFGITSYLTPFFLIFISSIYLKIFPTLNKND